MTISPKTVSTHIQRILTKLDVHSRAEAVSLALRHGLVDGVTGRNVVLTPSNQPDARASHRSEPDSLTG